MWTSHIINLADNTVRMANAAAVLDRYGLPWERIEGVNGWALPKGRIAEVYDDKANASRARQPLVPAEIGCYLSHIDAWTRIAGGNDPGGFVFEDDFAATDTLPGVLGLLSDDRAGDWDMVKLFSLDPAPRIMGDRALGPGHRLVMPYRVPTCLIGYALTRDAARRLVGRALPFFRPVDEDQKFFWETGLRVGLVLPPPVITGDQQAATGTVGRSRRAANPTSLAATLHKLRYQVGYQVALRRAWAARKRSERSAG
jgi:glycosyl transferase family 25